MRVNAARDGLMERNLDYVETYIVHQKRNHTERCGFLLDGQLKIWDSIYLSCGRSAATHVLIEGVQRDKYL